MNLWFIGNGCEDHLTTTNTSIPKDQRAQWRKTDARLCNILRQSIDAKKICYTLRNQVKKLYTNDIQRLYRAISSIANLKQPSMDISAYGGWMPLRIVCIYLAKIY